MPESVRILSVKQAAKILGLTARTVLHRIKRWDVPNFTLGKGRKVFVSEKHLPLLRKSDD